MFRYLKNLRDKKATKIEDIHKFNLPPVPKFSSKPKYKEWCSDTKTDHVFITLQEGECPSERISSKNPVFACNGIIIDYDAKTPDEVIEAGINTAGKKYVKPQYYHKTFSGGLRTIYPFKEKVLCSAEVHPNFIKGLCRALGVERLFAGVDKSSYEASQVFHLYSELIEVGEPLDPSFYKPILFKSLEKAPPKSSDTSIPLADVEEGIKQKYQNYNWPSFEVGSRGDLFFVEPYKDSEGCMVVEDGIVCFSTRAPQGFMTWKDLLGDEFIREYEKKKYAVLNEEFWYNGKSYYYLDEGHPVTISDKLLLLELKHKGFTSDVKPNKTMSEIDSAFRSIAKHNRVHEVAPCIWNKERVVRHSSNKILNSSNLVPMQPSDVRDPSKCEWSMNFIEQLFCSGTDHFFHWWKRIYESVLSQQKAQGQCLIIVGPSGRGKTLLSNKFVGDSCGGFADASDYIAGNTTFNKELAYKAIWTVDDTVSAASDQDQRRATEINKRITANPKIEVNEKYQNAVTVPWTGRIIITTNDDANSISVIPSLDSSNEEKIIALRVRDDASKSFPENEDLEEKIQRELPYLLREILEMKLPARLKGSSRYGVKGFIDPFIKDAAYDNSSRSTIAELIDWFCKEHRNLMTHANDIWTGTTTELQQNIIRLNDGKHLGISHNISILKRGLHSLSEVSNLNDKVRPVKSIGSGGGTVWVISLDKKYDLSEIDE